MANLTAPTILRLAGVAVLSVLLSGCYWWGPHHDHGWHGGPGGYHGGGGPGGYYH